MLVGCGFGPPPVTLKSRCLLSERKIILWFDVKRWLVSEDENPSLEEFLLLGASSEGNPES